MGFVREAVVSGMFYPGDPKTLAREIGRYLDNAEFDPVEGHIIGLISPHAGYVYSGQVAAYGMKAIRSAAYDKVILVGPSHRAYFRGAAIMEPRKLQNAAREDRYRRGPRGAIMNEDGVVFENAGAHGPEHSLEVQLPFLQTVLGAFKLVPIVMGSQEADVCEGLAGAIGRGVECQWGSASLSWGARTSAITIRTPKR